MKIIHPRFDDDGTSTAGVAVIHPCGDLPITEIARKDVPQGVPYRIIPEQDVPTDRTFRDAWEADFSAPDGYGDPQGYWAAIGASQTGDPS